MASTCGGTVAANLSLTQAEYLGGKGVPVIGGANAFNVEDTPPVWKLTGTADYDVDFKLEFDVSTTDSAGNEVETSVITHCTGTPRYNVELWIFEDMVVDLE